MYIQALLIIVAILHGSVDCAIRIDASQRVRARRLQLMAKRSMDDSPPDLKQLLHLTSDENVEEQWGMEMKKGTYKTRYVETYRGVRIYDTVVTSDKGNKEVTGTFFQDIDKDIKSVEPKLSKEEALNLFVKHNNHTEYNISSSNVDLYIYVHDEKARLVYEIVYMAEKYQEEFKRPMCLMDANTGEILTEWDNLESYYAMKGYGGNTKTGRYTYGIDYGYLMVTQTGSSCIMENDNVTVINSDISYYTAYNLGHCEGANDTVNGGYSPANDALYFGNNVYDMYKKWYGLSPLTSKIKIRVHYGYCYDNAIWSGGYVSLGDGCNIFYPLVSADIVSHEISHGFTEQNSGLVYRGMSGGMNEAYSDIAGEAAEYYLKGENDFKVGYEIKKNGALRYMYDPPKDGRSIDHVSNYYNGMNVHYSSGLFNKVFYLLCNDSGWDMKDAFRVFLVANRMYWYQDSTFDEGACGVIQAAKDFGYSTSDVIKAFESVGLKCVNDSSSFIELKNGQAVFPLTTASSSESFRFVLSKYTCGGKLEIKLSGGYVSGYIRMYIRKGFPVTKRKYDYLSYRYYSSSISYINHYAGCGKYYILITTSNYFRDVVLVSKYDEYGCKDENLCPGYDRTGLNGGKSSSIYYTIPTSTGCNITVSTYGGQGDLDVYIKLSSKPTETIYDACSLQPGNEEEFTFQAKGSTYYIMIYGYKSFHGATLSIRGYCFGPLPVDKKKRSLEMDAIKTKGTQFEGKSFSEIKQMKIKEAILRKKRAFNKYC